MLLLVDYGEIITFMAMAIASIIAIAVGTERTILFKVNSADKNDGFLASVIEKIREKDLQSIRKESSAHVENVYTRFVLFAMDHYDKGSSALEKMMSGRILREKIELEKRLPILNTLGNNAPFIGLLGTVLGVIKAFYNLGTLGNTGAEIVMKSISTALLATAAGLFIAIPVVMANNFFSKKLKVIDQNLEILAKEILASLDAVPTNHDKKESSHSHTITAAPKKTRSKTTLEPKKPETEQNEETTS